MKVIDELCGIEQAYYNDSFLHYQSCTINRTKIYVGHAGLVSQ
jgi:hypothetical protein